MVENIKLSGYKTPTPIQKYTIPSILQGFDVVGVAQTGMICLPLIRIHC